MSDDTVNLFFSRELTILMTLDFMIRSFNNSDVLENVRMTV